METADFKQKKAGNKLMQDISANQVANYLNSLGDRMPRKYSFDGYEIRKVMDAFIKRTGLKVPEDMPEDVVERRSLEQRISSATTSDDLLKLIPTPTATATRAEVKDDTNWRLKVQQQQAMLDAMTGTADSNPQTDFTPLTNRTNNVKPVTHTVKDKKKPSKTVFGI